MTDCCYFGFGGCCCGGCGCVNLDSISSCAPIASSSFVAFSITRGGGIIPFVPSLLLRNDSCKLFLLFRYLFLAHIELLLLHVVVGYPELDAEAQKRCQRVMVNDTKVVTVMHYGVYGILKFLFSYSKPYNLCFVSGGSCCLGSTDTSFSSNRFFYL
jgi:hypothetical protein